MGKLFECASKLKTEDNLWE